MIYYSALINYFVHIAKYITYVFSFIPEYEIKLLFSLTLWAFKSVFFSVQEVQSFSLTSPF